MSDVVVEDNTKAKEVVSKTKPWFNGSHTFSTVKVNPPKSEPTTLGISVGEGVKTTEKIG